jgi:hypothetical protein
MTKDTTEACPGDKARQENIGKDTPPNIIYEALGGDKNPAAATLVATILWKLGNRGWAFVDCHESARQQEAGVDEVKLRGYIGEVLADYDPEELYLKDGSLPSINRMMAYLRPYLRTAQPAAAPEHTPPMREMGSGWMPIDDAAKQGQDVLLAVIDADGDVIGVTKDYWYADRQMADWELWSECFDVPPTHYMPMPPLTKHNQIEVEQPQPAALSEEQSDTDTNAGVKAEKPETDPAASPAVAEAIAGQPDGLSLHELAELESDFYHSQQKIIATAKAIHYPACWDTMAYPTLFDALHELSGCVGCSECRATERESAAQPHKAEVVDIDGLCLKHVNAARAKHEMGPLHSIMKASSTELLWACRRLAKEVAAQPDKAEVPFHVEVDLALRVSSILSAPHHERLDKILQLFRPFVVLATLPPADSLADELSGALDFLLQANKDWARTYELAWPNNAVSLAEQALARHRAAKGGE